MDILKVYELLNFVMIKKMHFNTELSLAAVDKTKQRPLYTKLLTPELTIELDNLLNDWLESTSPTSHPAGYIIR